MLKFGCALCWFVSKIIFQVIFGLVSSKRYSERTCKEKKDK